MKKNYIITLLAIFMLLLDVFSPLTGLVLAEGNGGNDLGNIFTLESFKVNDSEYDHNTPIEIDENTTVSLRYGWSLIDQGVAGDFAQIKLPDTFMVLQSFSGQLNVEIDGQSVYVGDYHLDKDSNLLRLTFNENIESNDVNEAFLEFELDFDLQVFSENVRQKISFNDVENREIEVVAVPVQTSEAITKIGVPDSSIDANTITWTIDILNNSPLTVLGELVDELEDGLTLVSDSITITPILVGYNGQLTYKTDETVSINSGEVIDQNFTVELEPLLSYTGVQLQYVTTFTDFSKTTFNNTATYVFDDDQIDSLIATATVSGLTRSNILEKNNTIISDNQIQWFIDINKSTKSLSNVIVEDIMDEGLSYVDDSLEIVVLNLINGVWQEGAAINLDDIVFNENDQQLRFDFGNIDKQAYRIKYLTDVEFIGYYTRENTFINQAIIKEGDLSIGGDSSDATIIRKPILEKSSVSNVDFDNKTISWTIEINEAKHNINNVVLTDTLPVGLSLIVDSVKIFDEANQEVTSFTIDTNNLPKLTINFGDIGDNSYTIKYDTTVTDFTINEFINDAILTGTNIDQEESTSANARPNNNFYTKNFKAIDYAYKTISWEIRANTRREALSELTIIDTYPNGGLTLDETTLEVRQGFNGPLFVKGVDYSLSYIEGSNNFNEGFMIEFNEVALPINADVIITFKTSFDPELGIIENTSEDRKAVNQARFLATTINGHNVNQIRSAETVIDEAAWFSGKKQGRLVHVSEGEVLQGWKSGFSRNIEWEVYTNYLEENLDKEVIITDTLGYDANIDKSSVELIEYNVSSNGLTSLTSNVISSDRYELEVVGSTFTITFKEGYNERLMIRFLTDVPEQSQNSYYNEAKVLIDEVDKSYVATVTFDEFNKFLSKSEIIERASSNAFVDEEIEWKITLNESLSKIEDAVLSDVISSGLVLIEDSIIIKKIVDNELVVVSKEENYSVSIENNDINAQTPTTFSIVFEEDYIIDGILIVEYKTVVVTSSGTVNNRVDFTGNILGDEIVVETEELTARQLSFAGGTGSTRRGSLIINKLDSDNQSRLNASFELYYLINGEERIVEDRVFTTSNGVLRVDNLSYRTYFLREVETETGYVLLEEPIEIVLDSSTKEITVDNVQTIVLEKNGEVIGEKTQYDTVGDIIKYTITTRNTGQETLNNVEIIDEMLNKFVDGSVTIQVFNNQGEPTESSTINGQIVLEPGDFAVLIGDYAITQKDIDAGSVENTAYAKAIYRDDVPIESEEDEVVVEAKQNPSIEIIKTSLNQEVFDKVGDVIDYIFTVTNTGNVTLSNVEVTDDLVDNLQYITINGVPYISGPIVLAPDDVLIAQASYTVTQQDIDAGEVLNIASAKGTPPSGEDVVDSDNEDVTGSQQPSIKIIKNVINENEYTTASEVIEYEFIVTNTGNVTLGDVVITDDLVNNVEYLTINGVNLQDQDNIVLRPNDVLIAKASYTVTQQDMNALKIVNTASVKGTPPSGEDVEDEDEAIIEGESNPSISVVKEAVIHDINGIKTSEDSDVNYASLDEWVVYTIVATNSGNITLHNVEIVDDRDDLIDVSYVVKDEQDNIIETDVVNGQVSLDPNHSLVMVARLNITQQHIDDGVIENNASGIGYPQDPNNPESQLEDPVEDDDEANVVANQNSSLSLKKEVVNQSPYTQVGDLIEYRFVVENTGNTTLKNVRIIDELLDDLVYVSINGENIVDTSLSVNLKPKDVLYAIGEYRVRQKDVNAQIIENDAQAIGTTPNDEQVKDDDQATILGEYNPSISLSKEVTIYTKEDVIKQNQSAVEHISEYLMYEVISTNTGNITLHNVGIVDELEGLYDVSFVVVGEDNEVIDANTINNEVILQPNQSLIMRAKLDITQDILDQGFIDNQAFTNANPEDKDNPNQPSEEIVEDDDQESVGVNQTSEIRLVKEVLNTKNYSFKGEIITYQFTLTNTGNTTLSNVILEDDMIERFTSISLNGNAIAYTQDGFTLLSDDVLVIVGTYTVTQQDIEEGSIVNNAKVTATDINDEPLEDEDEAVIDADQKYDISLNKSNVVVNEQGVEVDQFSNENDQIVYRIVVTNSGNMIKYNVVINDIMMNDLEDIQYIHYDFNNDVIATYSSESIQPLNLMPNEVLELNATYTIKSSDLTNGKIRNVASITYTDEDGEILGDSDDFTQSYGLTTINLLKVDEKDKSKALEGAEFELTNEKTQQTFTVVTDAKGQATFSNLLFGEYTLKETKSPSGYALAEEEMIIVIDKENNTLVELTVTNKETIADMSDSSYYVSAGLLLLLGMLLLLISKDKKVKQ